MIRIQFTTAKGETAGAEAEAGDVLLTVAQGAGMPLEGTCEGQMACSTCHVILPREWFDRLPRPSEDEEDLLDLAAGACATSRLSCQIVLDETLDGMAVAIPRDAHDMSRA